MFEQSFVLAGPANRGPILSSVLIQVTAVGFLLLVPLIWVDQLSFLPTPPPELIMPRSPKPIKVFAEGVIRRTAPPQLVIPRPFTAPQFIPRNVANINEPRIIAEGLPLEVPTGPSTLTSLFDGPANQISPTSPPPKPKPTEARPVEPAPKSVSIRSDLQASKLIHQVKPAYPEIAKRAGVQGTVRLHAVIAQDGSVQKLQVVGGHPLLIQAAVEAVRQWRYSPTLLSGNPVEVVTRIDVNFVLAR